MAELGMFLTLVSYLTRSVHSTILVGLVALAGSSILQYLLCISSSPLTKFTFFPFHSVDAGSKLHTGCQTWDRPLPYSTRSTIAIPSPSSRSRRGSQISLV